MQFSDGALAWLAYSTHRKGLVNTHALCHRFTNVTYSKEDLLASGMRITTLAGQAGDPRHAPLS